MQANIIHNIKKKLKGSLNPQFIKKEKKFLYFKVGVLLYKQKGTMLYKRIEPKLGFSYLQVQLITTKTKQIKARSAEGIQWGHFVPTFFFLIYTFAHFPKSCFSGLIYYNLILILMRSSIFPWSELNRQSTFRHWKWPILYCILLPNHSPSDPKKDK